MKGFSNSDIPGSSPFIPEKRLLAAVLQRAITDYITGDVDLKDSARAWIMEDEINDAPLSFRFICEALDLDGMALRRAIAVQHESGTGPLHGDEDMVIPFNIV